MFFVYCLKSKIQTNHMKNLPYSWIILFVLFFVYLASNGFRFNTLTLWYPSLNTEFNLAKGQISEAPSLMLVLVAFLSPLFGYSGLNYMLKANKSIVFIPHFIRKKATRQYFVEIQVAAITNIISKF